MKNDGLNSIGYNVTRIKRRRLFTHIFVNYDETNIISDKYHMNDLMNITSPTRIEINQEYSSDILTNTMITK